MPTLEERVAVLESRIDQAVIIELDNRLTSRMYTIKGELELKIDRIEGKVDRIEGKVDRLEGKIDQLQSDMTAIKEVLISRQ